MAMLDDPARVFAHGLQSAGIVQHRREAFLQRLTVTHRQDITVFPMLDKVHFAPVRFGHDDGQAVNHGLRDRESTEPGQDKNIPQQEILGDIFHDASCKDYIGGALRDGKSLNFVPIGPITHDQQGQVAVSPLQAGVHGDQIVQPLAGGDRADVEQHALALQAERPA